jgi:hypothetical protein
MRGIDSIHAAIELVELHRAIDALPEVEVLDRDHLTEALPAPAVLAPLGKPAADSLADVRTGGDQHHARGPLQGLQATDDAQECESLPGYAGFAGFRLQTV